MKLHALSLSLFLSMSPLLASELASDYLTIEQQNEEMRGGPQNSDRVLSYSS